VRPSSWESLLLLPRQNASLYYLKQDEAADVYLYLTLYPPYKLRLWILPGRCAQRPRAAEVLRF